MSWITRFYEKSFDNFVKKEKVLIVYGPRRVGKTSLINRYLEGCKGKIYRGVGENMPLRTLLTSFDISQITNAFAGYDTIFIDEAQQIPNIGRCLKIMVDHLKDVDIIASGSSSFALSTQVGEPLTGRHHSLKLFPLSMIELKEQFGGMHIIENLEQYLIFGTYPEVLTAISNEDKKEYLTSLRDSYLFKDILELEHIRNSDKLINLLQLIAFQVGKEISLNELGKQLGISKNSVARYLDLLEKSYVIKKVKGFSRNLRKEIVKNSRYYFLDNGIRNALINNFNPLALRDDSGMLWENFLFSERMKKLHYHKIYANTYFWRTYDGKEIDLVEERDGTLFGYEFKWGHKKVKPPKLWKETYKHAPYRIISRDNFLEFLT